MPAWPQSIPGPIVGDLSIGRGSTFQRTNMAAGPARQRKTSSQAPDPVEIRVSLSRLELAIFEAWFKHELKDGTVWFTMIMPTANTQVAVEVRFVGEQTPYTTKSSVGRDGQVRFDVGATLEARNRPVLSAAQLAPYL
jgi:hypothetical protein